MHFNELMVRLGVVERDHNDAWDAIKYSICWAANGFVSIPKGATLQTLRTELDEYAMKYEFEWSKTSEETS